MKNPVVDPPIAEPMLRNVDNEVRSLGFELIAAAIAPYGILIVERKSHKQCMKQNISNLHRHWKMLDEWQNKMTVTKQNGYFIF